jgi:MFS family permease
VSAPSRTATPGGIRWRGALRHRNYRLFWFGQLVSLIGTWMQTIAQAWLVLTLTGDPLWLGIVSAAQFLPVMVLGLFGGVYADVLPKRKTLIGTQSAAMLLAFIMAALAITHVVQVWHVLVLAAGLGIVNAVDMPTRQSFVAEMVDRENLTNAVSLNSAIFNAARVVGPAVGGILIGAVGVEMCFFLNGVSFLAVIGGLIAMREGELRHHERLARPEGARQVLGHLGEGIRYVGATPVVLLAVCVVGIVSTFGMNFNVIGPALARNVLDVGATGLGFLMASMGVGSLTAALVVATFRRPRPGVIVLGGLVLGSLEVMLGTVRSYPVAIVVMFVIGFAAIAMAVSANTSIQMAVPDRLRGRVLGVYSTVFAGSTPIGAPIVGWLASALSTEVALVVSGGLSALAAIVAGVWVLRGGLDAPGGTRTGVRSGLPGAPALAVEEVVPPA